MRVRSAILATDGLTLRNGELLSDSGKLQLRGNRVRMEDVSTQALVEVQGAHGVVLQNCNMSNAKVDGGATGVLFRDCNFSKSLNSLVVSGAGTAVTATNTHITSAHSTGFRVDQGASLHLVDCSARLIGNRYNLCRDTTYPHTHCIYGYGRSLKIGEGSRLEASHCTFECLQNAKAFALHAGSSAKGELTECTLLGDVHLDALAEVQMLDCTYGPKKTWTVGMPL